VQLTVKRVELPMLSAMNDELADYDAERNALIAQLFKTQYRKRNKSWVLPNM
jgi:hypothetical protein